MAEDAKDYSIALATVNTLYTQFAAFARSTAQAFSDQHFTTMEGVNLSMKALTLAVVLQQTIELQQGEAFKDVLYVLEHGQLVLPAP